DTIVRALAPALPDRAVATGFDTTTSLAICHLDADSHDYQVVVEILGGGWGAGPRTDGADALDNPISNCANAPVEALENAHDHFRVVGYQLVSGSGGAGEHRGGLGFTRVYDATKDGVSLAAYSDRH